MIKRIFLIFIMLLFFIGIYYFFKQYNLNKRNAIEDLAEKNKLINILLVGRNTFKENKHNFYAIYSFYPETKNAGITFIPPNFEIEVDDTSKTIGEIDLRDFNKISSFIEKKLKISIPFYLAVYSPDVERSIDLLGGIDLFIINQAPGIDSLKFGLNYLDGNKVVKYINSAPDNSIFQKFDRIQDVLFTLYKEKDKFNNLLNLEFATEILKTIKTNILPQEILSLMKLLEANSSIKCTVLPGSINENGNYIIDDLSYKIYKQEFLKYLVYKHKNDKSIKLKILNGTGVKGLAKKIRISLIREGVDVVEFGNSPYPQVDESVIINQKGDVDLAKKLSKLTGINKIYHVIDNTELHNVLLIVGKDMHK